MKDIEKELNFSMLGVGFGLFLYLFGHFSVYTASNPVDVLWGAKLLDIAVMITAIALAVFSYFYTQSINKTLLLFVCSIAVGLIIVNLLQPYGMYFSSVDLNTTWQGYWKREYTELKGVRSFWQDISYGYSVIYLIFTLYVSQNLFKHDRMYEGIQHITALLIIVLTFLIDGYVYKIHEEFTVIFLLFLMASRIFLKLINTNKIETKFMHSEERYKRLVENSILGIYWVNLDTGEIIINSAGKEILGISNSAKLGLIELLRDTKFGNSIYKEFKNSLLSNGKVDNYITKIKNDDGTCTYIRNYARSIIDEKDNNILEGIFEDITEKKNAESLLIKAINEAERSDKLKSEFLAQMSHEIRTPINTILNYVGLLRSDWNESKEKEMEEYFNTITNASNRLIRTIDLILNMSQVQTGTYESKFTKINLFDDVLENLVNEFKPEVKGKYILFQLIRPEDDVFIFGDIYTITQIFANLISNSIKYTNIGTIKIYCKNMESKIKVTVEDSGIGIEEEFKKNIFNPFSQAQQGYTRKYDGTGLGLALVKKYCRLNNADIQFESTYGEGTTFHVDLIRY